LWATERQSAAVSGHATLAACHAEKSVVRGTAEDALEATSRGTTAKGNPPTALSVIEYRCLPDTIDARGTEGK